MAESFSSTLSVLQFLTNTFLFVVDLASGESETKLLLAWIKLIT